MSDEAATPATPARETFTEGAGFRPATGGGRVALTDARPVRALPPALIAKIEGKEPAAPAPAAAAATTEKPVEKPAEQATTATAETTASPAAIAEAAKPETAPATPPAPGSDAHAERDRLAAANAKLVAELEAAKSAPAKPDRVDTYRDLYYGKGPGAAYRQFLADVLEVEPDHADVQSEYADSIADLTADKFQVPLDEAKQAARNVALVKRSLARDQKARTAKEDAASKGDQAKADASKAAEHVAFIGNRLSLARTGTDGKPAPAYRDQFAVAAHLAPVVTGKPIEEVILESIPHLTKLGILDPARANDDDYLVSETAKYLDHQFTKRYQDLADAFGKARPSSPPSTAKTEPAKEPDATTSASQVSPQGHGGRSLTTANVSTAPATLPSTKTPDQPPKLHRDRKSFLAERFPDG